MTSADGGRTWSARRVIVDDKDALVNCISPGLTRMADGRLLLAYSWRSGGNGASNYGNCAKMVRISSDEGRTWSERIRITPDNKEYHTGCRSSYTLRMVVLSSATPSFLRRAQPDPASAPHAWARISPTPMITENPRRTEVMPDPLMVAQAASRRPAQAAARRIVDPVHPNWHGSRSRPSPSTAHELATNPPVSSARSLLPTSHESQARMTC
jgi:hypothetical protein